MTTSSPVDGWRPTITVAIPVLDEERRIEACLLSALSQTYPEELVDIVVADGGSRDRTREIVARVARQHPRVRLIDNPRRIQAAGLNRVIRDSSAELIARLDGHAAWPPTHLATCVEVMARTGAVNVGGAMDVHAESPLEEAVGRATASPFGVGAAYYRYGSVERDVDTVWLGCFRRDALVGAGLYDERLAVHEDYELNERLRRMGGRVVFSPRLPTVYWPRTTWRGLARQYARYGRAKAMVARRTPGVMRPHHLVPPVFVLAASTAALLSLTGGARRTARRLEAAGLGVYAFACIAAGAQAAAGRGPRMVIRTATVFPVLHLAWGAGFLLGLVSPPQEGRPDAETLEGR